MQLPIRAGLALLVLAAACTRPEPAQDAAPGGAPVASAGDVAPGTSSAHRASGTEAMTVTVYKSPTCGCCRAWVDHMREAGFTVVAIDTSDVGAVKRQYGVAQDLGSCHTALVGDYVLEGHVPAADVKRLLAERPAVAGLAVPGMPMGSPGMEGPMAQKYDVVAFDKAGARSVFASH